MSAVAPPAHAELLASATAAAQEAMQQGRRAAVDSASRALADAEQALRDALGTLQAAAPASPPGPFRPPSRSRGEPNMVDDTPTPAPGAPATPAPQSGAALMQDTLRTAQDLVDKAMAESDAAVQRAMQGLPGATDAMAQAMDAATRAMQQADSAADAAMDAAIREADQAMGAASDDPAS